MLQREHLSEGCQDDIDHGFSRLSCALQRGITRAFADSRAKRDYWRTRAVDRMEAEAFDAREPGMMARLAGRTLFFQSDVLAAMVTS
jgi:hypothetical protein